LAELSRSALTTQSFEFKINPVFLDKKKNDAGSNYAVSKHLKMAEVFIILVDRELGE